jgi:hypothetical protein
MFYEMLWYTAVAVTTFVLGRVVYCMLLQPVAVWDKNHPHKTLRTMIVLGSGWNLLHAALNFVYLK